MGISKSDRPSAEKILDIIHEIMIWPISKRPILLGLSEPVGGSPAQVRKGGF
ncbi:MAG: hypothetical protein ACUVWV_08645 [Thermodesulfobacteriota bacterium]